LRRGGEEEVSFASVKRRCLLLEIVVAQLLKIGLCKSSF